MLLKITNDNFDLNKKNKHFCHYENKWRSEKLFDYFYYKSPSKNATARERHCVHVKRKDYKKYMINKPQVNAVCNECKSKNYDMGVKYQVNIKRKCRKTYESNLVNPI